MRFRGRGARDRGAWGERAARRALRRAGDRILDRNVATRSGEIDVVTLRDGVIRFVEVKTRTGDAFGTPEEAFDREKRRRVRAAAREILAAKRLEGSPYAFDLVAIDLAEDGSLRSTRIHRDVM